MDSVMICRQASDPPTVPGCVRGWCSQCGKEIWVSPKGQEQQRTVANLRAYCNDCGLALYDRNRADFAGIVVNPAAKAALSDKRVR